MPSKRQQILDWVASGDLAPDQLEHALQITGCVPSAADNLRLLSRVVLAYAVLLLCSGVIFFFAYNWDDLSRFNKFIIAQGALLLSLLPLLRVNLQHPAGQASLFAACLLVGALLALVGQTYQSGADTYELFLVWAVLITPWTLLARLPVLWLLLLVLLNLSLVLALDNLSIHQFSAPFTHPLWSIFALNLGATGLWILATQRSTSTLLLRWGERIIALYSLLIITILAIGYVDSWSNTDVLTLPIWLGFSLTWLYLYRLRQLELMMLSALSLAAIILSVVILVQTLADVIALEALFLLLTLTVLGLSTAATIWLRHLSQRAKLPRTSGSTP